MRSLIIDDILSGGGNVSTEYYPGSFRATGSKCKVSGVISFKRMEDLLSNGGKSPSPCCSYNCRCQLKRMAEPELDLFQLLIKCIPSRTYKGIKENIEVQSMATSSISTIGRQVLSETGYQMG